MNNSDYAKRIVKSKCGRLLMLLAFVIAIIAQTSCGKTEPGPVESEEFYLDTICKISIYKMKDTAGKEKPASEMQAEAEAVIKDAFALCAELDNTLSRTKSDSDIGKINTADGKAVEVSDATVDVISKGVGYCELADGRFDITMGGVTELWDFHADNKDAKIPSDKKIGRVLEHVNYNYIGVDGNSIQLSDSETRLDLGGIAKGYIGDKMTEVLEGAGVTSAIINLGGNVICIGCKSEDEGFAIGVEAPYSNRSEIVGTVEAINQTMVTSGIYERVIEVDGKQYHHILDPDTGYPVDTDLISVTIIADKGRSTDADALSTICILLGYDRARKLIDETEGIEAVFILDDESVIATYGVNFEKK